jgi:hypothetical protein
LTAFQSNSSFHGTAAGVNGRQKITVMIPTQIVAARFIHRYFGPLFHGPGLNASPMRQRR